MTKKSFSKTSTKSGTGLCPTDFWKGLIVGIVIAAIGIFAYFKLFPKSKFPPTNYSLSDWCYQTCGPGLPDPRCLSTCVPCANNCESVANSCKDGCQWDVDCLINCSNAKTSCFNQCNPRRN